MLPEDHKLGGARKGAGRPKGSLNQPTKELQERAKALGCDPFELMLLFAKGDWKALGYESEFREIVTEKGVRLEPVIDSDLRFRAIKEASEYLYPKRRAIELSGQVDSAKDSELLEEVKLLREMLAGNSDTDKF